MKSVYFKQRTKTEQVLVTSILHTFYSCSVSSSLKHTRVSTQLCYFTAFTSSKWLLNKNYRRKLEGKNHKPSVKMITNCYVNGFFSGFLISFLEYVIDIDLRHFFWKLLSKNVYIYNSISALNSSWNLWYAFVLDLQLPEWSSELHDLLNWFEQQTYSLHASFVNLSDFLLSFGFFSIFFSVFFSLFWFFFGMLFLFDAS